ncbi:MAG: thioredoxin family protein [Muribaculaceae bacterium]|nr:thioredoxin family protein [Muribaculaceae bacterium]
MKRLLSLLLSLVVITAVSAQIIEPIQWNAKTVMDSETTGHVELSATIEDGWHLYNLTLPDGGPNPTVISFETTPGIKLIGDITPSIAPTVSVDMIFHLELGWWDKDVNFTQNFEVVEPGNNSIEVNVSFQACNGSSCIAPSRLSFKLAVNSATTPAETESKLDDMASAIAANSSSSISDNDLWAPVDTSDHQQPISSSPWWLIFVWGFGGGLLALLTPCVWPLIPMTVSFFLKKGTPKSKSIRDALIYGVSIIVIYLVLGLLITGIFGASKLNELSTNALFNIIFFLLLIVFAISFFGAFDIKLPSKWSNGMDNRAERTTGLVSIFFMAFTLALVSFSCTGPIIGTLLVEAASIGDKTGPAIGMAGFAIALALPFTLFAVFPAWLKEMPRSGGWLNSVKVVLGFLELALSLKFLSVADLAYGWGLLDREVFLALWIVIFFLLGMYLLGKIKFSHDGDLQHISVARFFLSLFSLSFAVYLIPGLWGAPLKGVSAFVPPLYTQDFNLYAGGQFEEFDDYETGMRYAADNNRPVLIDFSGYGCVNCRKMEGAVFDTDVVSDLIKENFVLIKLMVDDKTSLPTPIKVNENGKEKVLSTVGDKWSYLQRYKFAANTQPYYVILDGATGKLLAPTRSYNENITEFVEWLNTGMSNFKNKN